MTETRSNSDWPDWVRENEAQLEALAETDHDSAVIAEATLAFVRGEDLDTATVEQARDVIGYESQDEPSGLLFDLLMSIFDIGGSPQFTQDEFDAYAQHLQSLLTVSRSDSEVKD